jgi:hypothetical protein
MVLLVDALTDVWFKENPKLASSVGFLVSPRGGHAPSKVLQNTQIWAMDNDCFNGLNEKRFIKMLELWRGIYPSPKFVSVPDVVGDSAATLRLFSHWNPIIRQMGYPSALVAQDGLAIGMVEWDKIAAIFVGGTTKFKLSVQSADLCREAKLRGKWVHMGRVSTLRRTIFAMRLGCDSIDGSRYSKWKNLISSQGLKYIRIARERIQSQKEMF